MTLDQGENAGLPEIKHHVYENGKIQSLGFKTADGRDATIGVIHGAGNWDFGEANRREQITITSGEITSADEKSHYPAGNVLTFEKGDKIQFRTSGPASYICIYGD